jgi:hypothetical protein
MMSAFPDLRLRSRVENSVTYLMMTWSSFAAPVALQ